jgi:hypothetical protein
MLHERRFVNSKSFSFIMLALGIQIFLIFFYIYHKSVILQKTFHYQRLEKSYQQLLEQKKELLHTLETIKSRSFVKQYAENRHWRKIRLDDIKRLPHDQQSE